MAAVATCVHRARRLTRAMATVRHTLESSAHDARGGIAANALASFPASAAAAASAAGVSSVAAASPFTSTLQPWGSLSFLSRLITAIGSFLLTRLKRLPYIASLVAAVREWLARHEDDALLSLLRALARRVRGALAVALRLAVWTLDPVLFVRRLYRFCVAIVVLYCAHACGEVALAWCRGAREWLRIEKGIWWGEEACVRKRELDTAMATAGSYAEWRQAAAALDVLEGERTVWKGIRESGHYQYRRIERNVESLRNLIAAHKAQQAKQGAGAESLSSSAPAPGSVRSSPLPQGSPLASSAPAAASAVTASTNSPGGRTSESLFQAPAASADPHALMRFLRSRLNRHIGNITHSRLYHDAATDHFSSEFLDPATAHAKYRDTASPDSLPQCRVGTKSLIESYHREVVAGLDTVLHDASLPAASKLAFFRETRHAYGRSALMLNGGSNLGLLHLGVVAALVELDSLPQVICGNSTGAIFAALICSRSDSELAKIASPDFLSLEFPSVAGSLRRKWKRFVEEGILMDMHQLIHCVRGHIGDLTFEQAYQRHGRILNIVVTPVHRAAHRRQAAGEAVDASDDSDSSSDPILLNYLTAPSVLIWSAACASCAFPHLYQPVDLLAKSPDGSIHPYFGRDGPGEHVRFAAGCVDGQTVKMDTATDRLRTLFNCNNFIVSQLNLSLIPFIFGGTSFGSAGPMQKLLRYLGREVYQRATNLCCLFGLTTERVSKSRLGRFNLVRIALYIHSLTSQQIFGDITLVPPVSLSDYAQLLENPSNARLQRCVEVARRYTWTRGAIIQAHTVVEVALDRCVRKAREQAEREGAASGVGVGATFPTAPLSSVRSSVPPPPSASHAHSASLHHALVAGLTPSHGLGSSTAASLAACPPAHFWSRKLNARAMQPPRKGSVTGGDGYASGGGMPPPPLDLGRTSPDRGHPFIPGYGLSTAFAPSSSPLYSHAAPVAPMPYSLQSNGAAHWSPSAAAPPAVFSTRARSHSSSAALSPSPVVPPLTVVPTLPPLSPPVTQRHLGPMSTPAPGSAASRVGVPHAVLLPSSGIEFVGGSVRPPPSVLGPLRRLSFPGRAAETPSPVQPRVEADTLAAADGEPLAASPVSPPLSPDRSPSPSSSVSGSPIRTPVPAAAQSRDDLDQVAMAAGMAQGVVMSRATTPGSARSSQATSRAHIGRGGSATGRVSRNGPTEKTAMTPLLLAASPTPVADTPAATEGASVIDGSLLRSVPSLPGREGNNAGGDLLASVGSPSALPLLSSPMLLPSTASPPLQPAGTIAVADRPRGNDSFNRGVLAHLEQSMTGVMPKGGPKRRKVPRGSEQRAADGVTEGRRAVVAAVAATTSGSESSSDADREAGRAMVGGE